MEKIKTAEQKLTAALKTMYEGISTLNDSKYKELHTQLRDSLTQRFEFSVDLLWKYLRLIMQHKLKVNDSLSSPSKIIQAAAEHELVTYEESEELVEIAEDRNQTSHSYNEELAEEIAKRVPEYYRLMKSILDRHAAG